jgi:hypothetical protein
MGLGSDIITDFSIFSGTETERSVALPDELGTSCWCRQAAGDLLAAPS